MVFATASHTYLTNDYERSNMLKPILTRWDNNVFRSRNEARWAVFFDALDVLYKYEPVGVYLPNDMMYLPDFYIADTGTFVDAKEDGFMDSTSNKPNLKEALNYFNNPFNKGVIIEGYEQYQNSGGLLITPQKMFLNTPNGPYGSYHERNKELEYALYNFSLKVIGVSEDDPRFKDWNDDNPNFKHIQAAMKRAIGATFEHGEAPVPIGFRSSVSNAMLVEEFDTTVIGQHKGDYVWDHMDDFQLKNLYK